MLLFITYFKIKIYSQRIIISDLLSSPRDKSLQDMSALSLAKLEIDILEN